MCNDVQWAVAAVNTLRLASPRAVITRMESISLMTQGSFRTQLLMTAPRNTSVTLPSIPNNMSRLPQGLWERTWLSVCFSFFCACYLNVVHTLGLLGCAEGKVAVTGDPNMSLVFPPGGFRRCRVCTGIDSSKIPLPFPPAETSTEQWAIQNISLLPPFPVITSESSSHSNPSPVPSSGQQGWGSESLLCQVPAGPSFLELSWTGLATRGKMVR